MGLLPAILAGGSLLASLIDKPKKPKPISMPQVPQVEEPEYKKLTEKDISNIKEQALAQTQKTIQQQTTDLINYANRLQGMRVGGTLAKILEQQQIYNTNLATMLANIDLQALQYNNQIEQWLSSFRLNQQAHATNIALSNSQMQYNYNLATWQARQNLYGSLFYLATATDKLGNFILPKIF
ncbi:MAG TPA: hypothetical protein PLD27_11110 [bacterium]|nr:hypothetical protein [bacterium]